MDANIPTPTGTEFHVNATPEQIAEALIQSGGWAFSQFSGEFGGWTRMVGANEQVVCAEQDTSRPTLPQGERYASRAVLSPDARYLAVEVVSSTGETVRSSSHATRDEAFAQLAL